MAESSRSASPAPSDSSEALEASQDTGEFAFSDTAPTLGDSGEHDAPPLHESGELQFGDVAPQRPDSGTMLAPEYDDPLTAPTFLEAAPGADPEELAKYGAPQPPSSSYDQAPVVPPPGGPVEAGKGGRKPGERTSSRFARPSGRWNREPRGFSADAPTAAPDDWLDQATKPPAEAGAPQVPPRSKDRPGSQRFEPGQIEEDSSAFGAALKRHSGPIPKGRAKPARRHEEFYPQGGSGQATTPAKPHLAGGQAGGQAGGAADGRSPSSGKNRRPSARFGPGAAAPEAADEAAPGLGDAGSRSSGRLSPIAKAAAGRPGRRSTGNFTPLTSDEPDERFMPDHLRERLEEDAEAKALRDALILERQRNRQLQVIGGSAGIFAVSGTVVSLFCGLHVAWLLFLFLLDLGVGAFAGWRILNREGGTLNGQLSYGLGAMGSGLLKVAAGAVAALVASQQMIAVGFAFFAVVGWTLLSAVFGGLAGQAAEAQNLDTGF